MAPARSSDSRLLEHMACCNAPCSARCLKLLSSVHTMAHQYRTTYCPLCHPAALSRPLWLQPQGTQPCKGRTSGSCIECAPCPEGTYRSGTGFAPCTACASGSTSLVGSTDVTACTPCLGVSGVQQGIPCFAVLSECQSIEQPAVKCRLNTACVTYEARSLCNHTSPQYAHSQVSPCLFCASVA